MSQSTVSLFVAALMLAGSSLRAEDAVKADAYVESTVATQYVNTGYCVGPNTKIELDFQLTAVVLQARLFGTGDLAQRTDCYIGSTASGIDCFSFLQRKPGTSSTQGANLTSAPADLARHVAVFDKRNRHVALLTSGAVADEDSFASVTNDVATRPLALFGCNYNEQGTSFSYFCPMRVYSLKIYESDSLVRNFIPALKDGRAGLYDTLTKLFVCDTRTTAQDLAYGGDILDLGEDGYVESTGEQGINLRHFNVPGTRLEVDYAIAAVTGTYRRIYGNSGGSAVKSFNAYYDGSTPRKVRFSCGDSWTETSTGVAVDTNRHTIVQSVSETAATFAYVTGCTTNYSTEIEVACTEARPWPISLFGNSMDARGFTVNNPSRTKVYGCRIWVGDELVHDYVPCLKGGVAGLKDRVDGAFVTSEPDVDPLLSGGDIATEAGDGYIESSGTQYIDTGYFANDKTRIELDFAPLAIESAMSFFGNSRSSKLAVADYFTFVGYQQDTGRYRFGCQVSSEADDPLLSTTYTNNLARRTYVLDAANARASVLTRGYTNCTYAISTSYENGQQTMTLPLFGARYSDGIVKGLARMRLYGCRIYDNGTLVKDYVPFVRDGVAGLSNRVEGAGEFISNYSATNNFAFGGAILGDAGRLDAYVESDGTQAIDTDYFVKQANKPRIEVDFAYGRIKGSERIFSMNGNFYLDMYINGSAVNAGSFSLITGDSGDTQDNTGGLMTADRARHVAVVDIGKKTFSLSGPNGAKKSGKLPYKQSAATYTKDASNPLGLFCKCSTSSGKRSYANVTQAKIYSFRVYEDDVLVHEYLPYTDGTRVGFKDTQTGNVLVNTKTETQLAIGGGGYGGSGLAHPFVETPRPQSVRRGGEPQTIAVFAPGAVGYRWTRNGEVLEGVTGDSVQHAWIRGQRETVYTVTARFNVSGETMESEPMTITVANEPSGFLFIVK